MKTSSPEDGQATIFVIGMALVALAVTAFSIEGTRAFLMRRTLQNAADGAALAGASELDRETYYSTGGSEALIDPVRGEAAVVSWLDRRGLDVQADLEMTPTRVSVELRTDLPTSFLNVIGIDSVPVAAEAEAEPLVAP